MGTIAVGAGGLILDLLTMAGVVKIDLDQTDALPTTDIEVDAFIELMFNEHARSLVRMTRLFVDDRTAAEDIVQEAFIRLARSVQRIEDPAKAAAYLRSIVLNLARDHNRRGLVSLRHRLPLDEAEASAEDDFVIAEDHQRVVDALRELPSRQRDCVVLRYYDELGIDDIASTLGISRNSVKTHLTRAMRSLEGHLTESQDDGELE